MSSESKVKSYFPRTVDRPMLVLFWEYDEFMVFLVPVILLLPTRQLILGVFAWLAAVFAYMKFKKNKPDNFLEHLMWKFGIDFKKPKGLPDPSIQEFLE